VGCDTVYVSLKCRYLPMSLHSVAVWKNNSISSVHDLNFFCELGKDHCGLISAAEDLILSFEHQTSAGTQFENH
jgi:hypothetical protein